MKPLEVLINVDELSSKLHETPDTIKGLKDTLLKISKTPTNLEELEAILQIAFYRSTAFTEIYIQNLDKPMSKAKHFVREEDFDYV